MVRAIRGQWAISTSDRRTGAYPSAGVVESRISLDQLMLGPVGRHGRDSVAHNSRVGDCGLRNESFGEGGAREREKAQRAKAFWSHKGLRRVLMCRKGLFSTERERDVNHLVDGRKVRFAHDWRVESSWRKKKKRQQARRGRGEDKRTCWVNG